MDKIERAQWHDRKMAQWNHVSGQMPGLQLIKTKDTFVLAIHSPAFSDSVVIGAPARVAIDKRSDRALNLPRIDLTTAQIEEVFNLWRRRRPAPKSNPLGLVAA